MRGEGPTARRRQVQAPRSFPRVILRRLARACSPAAVRSPAAYSPGPPRSEPSTRGSLRKKVGFSNLNRRPDRMPAYVAGLRRKTEGETSVCMRHRPRQFPLRPYIFSAERSRVAFAEAFCTVVLFSIGTRLIRRRRSRLFLGRDLLPDTGWPRGPDSTCKFCRWPA